MSVDAVRAVDAFDDFFRTHYSAVRRFARSLVSEGDVDDIVASTFQAAWQKFDQIPAGAARAWLFGTARNMARNRWAMGRRAGSLVDAMSQAGMWMTSQPADVEPDGVDFEQLLVALRGLSEQDRQLVVMTGWFEMTPTEIAQATGQPPGNIRVRLHRLRKVLRPLFFPIQGVTDRAEVDEVSG